ncbi:MAG: transketolase [Nitriliruptoraceae bacterium]
MSLSADPSLRDDVVAISHGTPQPLPPGTQCDAIDAIRFLAADAVERAGSGHPGTAMALAPVAYELYARQLRHDPQAPHWADRDRFVLSVGHASLLQYAALHLSGYDLDLEDLQAFRTLGSRTPGHPERGHTEGVEVGTGPLGQGISMGVGLALAERMLAARFNQPGHTIVDHRTWVIAGDGDMMEGVTSEATSLAGTLGLDRLTVLYDDNHISIEGGTEMAFCEDVARRFDAHGWQVLRVDDANDLAELTAALDAARADTDRPTIVIVRTHIGYGSPKQDDAAAHGAPLGAEAIAATREKLGWEHAPFEIPGHVYDHWHEQVAERAGAHAAWQDDLARYRADHPELAAEFERRMAGQLPDDWADGLLDAVAGEGPVATRASLGAVLNAAAARLPELVGGSADLAPSTVTTLDGEGDVTRADKAGRNLHFGVREHAMGAIVNGLAAHGGLRPFGATFLVFSDYVKPAIRLSALMQLPVLFVFTHDSIGLGEDGPTHQPIEQLASLRATPGLTVLRPADANETASAVRTALELDGPVALILSRQKLPVLPPDRMDMAGRVVADGTEAVIVATGSEVSVALGAREALASTGRSVRVVSLPSWELFRARPATEQDELLPPDLPTVAVEAASPQGWREFADEVVGLDRFGASGAAEALYEHFRLTPEAVAARVGGLLDAG